jgi:hypothetical protein
MLPMRLSHAGHIAAVTVSLLALLSGCAQPPDTRAATADVKAAPSPSAPAGTAPVTEWEGKWSRVTDTQFDSSELEITKAQPSTFMFHLSAGSGGHTRAISGTAAIQSAEAAAGADAANTACRVVFARRDETIAVSTTPGCSGGGVRLDGSYRIGAVARERSLQALQVLANDGEEQAFKKMVRGAYPLFIERMQMVSVHDDLDGLGAYVRAGGVRGLFTEMEAIVIVAPAGRMWAAAIDDDVVRYFTNDSAFARRLPRTIEKWRERFSDKKVVFPK